MQLPVLILTYNRAQLLEKQLQLLLNQKLSSMIYIAVDGPKKNPEDVAKVHEVHQVIQLYQKRHPKKILSLLATHNQGCQKGVESGISWFFTQVPAGIILEDDCQPHPDFFKYCAELLTKYETDTRIGMISGTNPLVTTQIRESYLFSRQSIIWGWATWAHKWQAYHKTKRQAAQLLKKPEIRAALANATSAKHLIIFDRVVAGEIDTWDFIWYLTNLLEARYCIIPSKNLISNVGFNAQATHTKIKTTQSELPQHSLKWPLKHPAHLLPNIEFENGYLSLIKPWNLAWSALQAYAMAWGILPTARTKKSLMIKHK